MLAATAAIACPLYNTLSLANIFVPRLYILIGGPDPNTSGVLLCTGKSLEVITALTPG